MPLPSQILHFMPVNQQYCQRGAASPKQQSLFSCSDTYLVI